MTVLKNHYKIKTLIYKRFVLKYWKVLVFFTFVRCGCQILLPFFGPSVWVTDNRQIGMHKG